MTTAAEGRQFCTFELGRWLFGVPVLSVQEVLREQAMTTVPLAPPAVRGLINLRGQIVTAVDLRRRLGLEAGPADRPSMNVVIRTTTGPVSLLVDEIGDVLDVEGALLEAPPETIPANVRDLIAGIHKLKNQLLLLLDTEKAVAVDGPA